MFLNITLILATLFVLFFLWGVFRLRKGNAQATEAICKVRLEDIKNLVTEGKEVLAETYSVTINLSELEVTANTLDELFVDQTKLKGAFRKDSFSWRFVLPIGALVGELVQIHAKGVWKQNTDGLFMEIPVKDGTATCYPFHKILKHAKHGEKGDLYAFLISSVQLSAGKALA